MGLAGREKVRSTPGFPEKKHVLGVTVGDNTHTHASLSSPCAGVVSSHDRAYTVALVNYGYRLAEHWGIPHHCASR